MPQDADRFDFFVSYARADNAGGWITRFVEELVSEHRKFSGGRALVPFFDRDEIRSGEDWQHRLQQGLAASRLFLAFISPAYFASEWCRREWRTWIDTEIAKHILSDGAAPVYIVEVPGLLGSGQLGEQEVAARLAELCAPAAAREAFIDRAVPMVRQVRRRQVSAVQPFFSEGVDALRRDDLHRVLQGLARDLDERAERVRRAAESASTVPPYNRRFTGRLEELLALREQLANDRAGVICGLAGLGGVGKSELAFTYAHAFASAYPGGRFLVPCEGRSDLREAVLHLGELRDFRDRIDDEARKSTERHFAAITALLAERLARLGPVLLVLDNVSDAALLAAQQTDAVTALGPKLHVLATTRLAPPAGTKGRWLTLGELPEGDALDLLEKHRPMRTDADRAAGLRIVRQLGGFTLAVELVAAYLAAHDDVPYERLAGGLDLGDLDQIAGDDEVELRRHNHERRLTAVLGPVLGGLAPEERRTLEYAAQLPADLVPLPWLRSLVVAEFPAMGQQGKLTDPWSALSRRLMRQALLSRAEGESSEPRLVRVHRLLQELVRRGMAAEETERCRTRLADLVEQRLTALVGTTVWVEARWEIAPLEAVVQSFADAGEPRAMGWLGQVGRFAEILAWWPAADTCTRRALELAEKRLAANDPNLAGYLGDRGDLLRQLNRKEEAEPLLRRALQMAERSFGPEHPKVAAITFQLAELRQDQGAVNEAELLHRRTLAIRERQLPPDHPDVGRALNALGCWLIDQDRFSEAEPLVRRALAITRQHEGDATASYASNVNNVAVILGATGRGDEAEPLLREAVAIYERCYGLEHPRTAIAWVNLAARLVAMGRPGEALGMLGRAVVVLETFNGPEHPLTATARSHRRTAVEKETLRRTKEALALRDAGRVAEAESALREVLAMDEAEFGPSSATLGTDLTNLGAVLADQKRWSEAEPLLRRALAIANQDDPGSRGVRPRRARDLAEALTRLHQPQEAEALLREAVAIAESVPGAVGEVALSVNQLGTLFHGQKRWNEARPLFAQALETATRAFGPDHPTTVTIRGNLESCRPAGSGETAVDLNERALARWNAGFREEAEMLLRRAIALARETGEVDASTMGIFESNLGQLLLELERPAEAGEIFERSVARAEAAQPPDLRKAASRIGLLASCLAKQNRTAEHAAASRRQIDLLERSGPEAEGDLVLARNEFGVALLNRGEFAEAEGLLCTAAAAAAKLWGEADSRVASIRGNFRTCRSNQAVEIARRAVALADGGQPAAAEPLLREVLAREEADCGADHPSIESDLLNLGSVLIDLNRCEEAEVYLRRAVNILERDPAAEPKKVVSRLQRLAIALGKTGRIEERRAIRQRCAGLLERMGADGAKALGELLNNLGNDWLTAGNPADAIACLRRGVEVYQDCAGKDPAFERALLQNLATALARSGDAEGAIEQQSRLVGLCNAQVGAEAPETVDATNVLGVFLHGAFRYFEAAAHFRRALEIGVRRRTAERPVDPQWVANLRATLEALGQTPAQIYEELRSIAPDLAE